MEYTKKYPENDTNNFMWKPLNFFVHLNVSPTIIIQARTCGRNGAKITILEDNKEISSHTYDYRDNLGYHFEMAKDAAKDIELIEELLGKNTTIDFQQFVPLMQDVRDKCESRYGNLLPNYDYEALILFYN